MTSPCESVTVRCRCGHVFQDWIRQSVNLDLDPGLGDPEYLRDCASAVCPSCGERAWFDRMLVVRGGVFEFRGAA
jgi:hypothetical protein